MPTAAKGQQPYRIEYLSIPSNGINMVSRLYVPNTENKDKFPVVVILGPIGSVKEQSPIEYATRLAKYGIASLIFDPRYHGETGGEPRRYEGGQLKADDVIACLDFLESHDDVDATKLYALGICQGVNWVVKAVLSDKRMKRLALVSGHYLYRAFLEVFFRVTLFQDQSLLDRRIAGGKAALEKFQTTGEVDYIPIVGTAPDRLLPQDTTADYYLPWENQKPAFHYYGKWENRVTKMSEYEIWTTEVDKLLQDITIPVLIVSGEFSATPASMLPKLFDNLKKAPEKDLRIMPGKQHLQYYEDAETIDQAVAELIDWYRRDEH